VVGGDVGVVVVFAVVRIEWSVDAGFGRVCVCVCVCVSSLTSLGGRIG
jgi:hypothetical protein